MPKDKVSEWSSTPSNNTDIGGINIAEGCAPSGINNAIRELMAQVKDMQAGSDGDGLVVGGTFTSSGGAVISGAATFSNTVVLGGSATATTPSASDDSTKVATTAFVKDVALPDTSGNGIVVRTGALTVTNRQMGGGTGIVVTNPDGVDGNFVITNTGVTSVNSSTGSVTVNDAKAWVNFNGTGTVAIRASFNVTSITDHGVGEYTVNFTNALTDANYCSVGLGSNNSSSGNVFLTAASATNAPTSSSLRLRNILSTTAGLVDSPYISIAAFR